MSKTKQNYTFAFTILTSLFFLWGFTTVNNDILIPYFKEEFVLNDTQSMLVNLSFFGSYGIGAFVYFLFSHLKGDPINKMGYKNGIIAGLITSGLACLLFYPLAELNNYYIMLVPLFILGVGFTLLQISCNPYVAILGSEETASSRLNLSQGFNSLGTTIGPMLIGFIILSYFEGKAAIQIPYMFLGLFFLAWALFLFFIKIPDYKQEESPKLEGNALRFGHVRFGMFAIFAYVGAEVAIGSKLIEYVQLPEIASIKEHIAPSFVGTYWGGMMIGRLTISVVSSAKYKLSDKIIYGLLTALGTFLLLIIAVTISNRLSTKGFGLSLAEIEATFHMIWPLLPFMFLQFLLMILFRDSSRKALTSFSVVVVILLIVAYATQGTTALWCIIAIGLFNSIMWSNIFTLSIEGLKEYTSQASSLLIIMIVGGAVIPLIMGWISDATDLITAYLIPIISYLYIAFFGIFGTKKQNPTL